MGKTFGLFACASVVAASVWWASSQQTGQAVLAQIDPGSGIGGPPGFGGPPSEGDAQLQAAQRARISDMMRRAAQMEQRGNLNAAIRFAASADALVRSSGIPLNPQAESPAEFIARLQGKSAPQNGGEPQTGNPFAAASQPSRPAPTVPGTDSPAKQQAQELLRQGRQAFQSGDLLSARELALEAQRIQATWTLFEDNPTQLLDDIERKTNTTTFAAAPFPSESPDAQNMANNPFADPREAANGSSPVESLPQPAESPQPAGNPFAVTGQAPAAPQPNQNDLNKAEAQKLMAAARKDAEAGRFDEAREKLKKAESLKVIYNISDERPALVLRDIARMESEAGQLAQITPGVSSQPSAGDEAKREQAQKLLEEARAAIRSGQFDAAEKKIEQARTLNAPYQQFDDTPELVAELLKRFRPSDPQDVPVFPGFPPVATTSEPVASNEPPAPKSFPPVPQRPAPKAPVIEPQAVPEPERIEAPKVADNAPAEPEVNPFAAAPQTEAPLAEAPLAEAPQVEPVAPPQPIPSQPTSPKPPQPEAQGAFDIANKAPAPPETEPSTIHPDGVVAAELYDRGLKHYYDGRYEEAYDAFLNCYRTGQKMDPYRAQSLQDMLQTLRPIIAQRQAAGDIQQTSGQRRVGPGTGNDFGGIDQAEREQNVKYEKLRSEALNNIFKAERLKEKSPTEALELIDRTMTIVSDADLTEQQLAPLVRQLKMARGEIEAWQKQRAPLLELEERNAKVKDIIVQQRRTEIRIEQELADLVEEYNTLFRQRRYAEAEVIAKEAKELDPENPVTETMFWKARFARRDARNEELKIAKEEGFIRQLDSVEWSAIPIDDTRPFEFPDPKTWEELTKRRSKYGTDNRIRTDKEIQIEKSLIRPISLHFTETPLNEVIKHIAAAAGINVVVDNLGLSEEGILPDQPVTINVDEIRLSSALNLMLEPLHLSYMIQDEVLKITSKVREQGEMKVVTYPVADLVIPIPNFKPSGGTGLVSSGPGHNAYSGPANFSVPAGGSLNPVAQYQVGDNFGGLPPINDPWAGPGLRSDLNGGGSNVDFDTLSDLIISTIEPESWAEAGGGGQVKSYETTLSLVIRQTQQVHEEIRDLLEQLRRLQDLQVTIEVRFVTVADRFFERIGIDFDFNVQDNVEADTVGLTPPPFGTPLGVLGLQGQQNQQGQQAQQGQQGQGAQTGVGGIGGGPGARNMLIMGVPGQVQGQQQGGQQQGQQAQQGQVAQAGGVGGQFLQPGANMNLPALDDWPKNGTIVGLSQPGQFTPDLDIGFQQGSFDLGVPDFGNFQPSAGIEVGMAILTDIEAFFFINAAQADERSNIMFAPKVTMFNGQQATVQSTTQRPFVTSLVPTVGFAAVGFTPQITVLSEGVTMQVLAVISADRRFVRLTVVPNFTNITDVFTFTFSGGGGGGQAGGQANTGVAGQGGFNPIGGQGGGIAGGQVGGQIGVGGIGGGPVAPNALALGLPSQMGGQFGVGGIGGVGGVAGGQVGGIGGVGGGIGGIGGVGGGQVGAQVGGVGGGAAVGATTIQQPVFEVVNVTTTVSVPDGGTVLLGGIKRLREGRNMAGVPILNKIPYISRLFKNTGVGRETESLMLMVTPRIIIQEEEEELLGIPL